MSSDAQNLLAQLQQPIESQQHLEALLAAPLAVIGLLPAQFHRANTQPLPPNAISIEKHIGQIQQAILAHIAPVWAPVLGPSHQLLTQYFAPDLFANARPAAGAVARTAYASLLTSPATDFALALLARLADEYPVDRLFRAVFVDPSPPRPRPVADVHWADTVRDICAVPDRVANALGPRARTDTPPALDPAAYFATLSTRTAALFVSLAAAKTPVPPAQRDALAYLLSKLVHVGVFPPAPPTQRTQPSFFAAALPTIRTHLSEPAHAALWAAVLRALPSSLTLQAIVVSLCGALAPIPDPLDASPPVRSRVRAEAALLEGIVGNPVPTGDDACWDVVTGLMFARDWSLAHARVFVCWLSGAALGRPLDTKALLALLDAVLATWASPAHVKHSLLAKHRFTTAFLLLTLSCIPPSVPDADLVANANFISGVGHYIAHPDPAIRRLGMLAAEVIAHRGGRPLDFGDWTADDEDRVWCRALRALLAGRDVDAELIEDPADAEPLSATAPAPAHPPPTPPSSTPPPSKRPRAAFARAADSDDADSDDSLAGYASPTSSRSASPAPEELAEIEADPTLSLGRARVPRPVYLAQLGALLRGTSNVGGARGMGGPLTGSGAGGGPTGGGDAHDADRVQAGLDAAEELIRRKRDYGTELAENAVDLACVLVGLNDNYELEGFAEKRQGALNALVACAPVQAAPTLIQEFFKNQYSIEQRFVMLTALAVGARELASLPDPGASAPFPSKTLPAPLHRKYLPAADDTIPRLADSISRVALDSAAAASTPASTSTDPAAAPLLRERRLRLATPRKGGITELPPASSPTALNPYASSAYPTPAPAPRPAPTFAPLAAEYFIVPLINAFYGALHAAHAREARTALQPAAAGARFAGAGTGLVLSAVVVAQLLRTLAVLVHAARAAPAWLAVVAPAALEMALAAGTRRLASAGDDADADGQGQGDAAGGGGAPAARDAPVLSAALELALVVLDGALALDGGRALALENTLLVRGAGEWGGAVLGALERGARVPGGGGAEATRVGALAAGVALKVEEIAGRWGRSMVQA